MTHDEARAKVREKAVELLREHGREKWDVDVWLEVWLDVPQYFLRGCTPRQAMADPDGLELVLKLLGSFVSGAFQ